MKRSQRAYGLSTAKAAGGAAALGLIVTGLLAYGQPTPEYEGSCSSAGCHDSYSKRKAVHAPVAEESCDACHEASDKGTHKFVLTSDATELCMDCHDEDFSGEVQHSPAEAGECTACHDPHATDVEHLLTLPTVGELCADCHEEVTEDHTYLHGPVAAGACTSCHDPHAAEHPSLLFAEGPKVCGKCHAAMVERLENSAFTHDPARESCATCHDAHGGDNQMSLSAMPPALCLDCHDDVGEAIADAEVDHGPVTTGKACASCHDPHASAVEHGLVQKPAELCLSCHSREVDSEGGKVADIGQIMKDNPHHHAPITQEGCSPCHGAHGGANHRLLAEAFPREFYASFEEERYALCFMCHEVEMLEEEETDEATAFRNGERNLHYLHVNREVKGRTCRACHDPHASSQPRQIVESVPFGEWSIPINFKITETGGSCAPGCHRSYGYDRETPVENFPSKSARAGS